MTKVIEKDGDWSELSVSTSKKGKRKKSIQLWSDFGYFGTESCDFSIERANQPENTIFYVNQEYQSYKGSKKVYYNVFIISQIMPLSHQPKDVESYELKDDEVKTLRPRYNMETGEFLGIEYAVSVITVRNDPNENFFDYGYNKEKDTVLYNTREIKIPNSLRPQFSECIKHSMKVVHLIKKIIQNSIFICHRQLTKMKKSVNT